MSTIKINNLEIEKSLHTEMNRFSLIKIPKGWRLLTFEEFMDIWNNHKDKFDFSGNGFDEIVKHPLGENKNKYPFWNVWLSGLGDDSDVIGNYRCLIYYTVRGVRFCRDLEVKK